MAWGEAHIPYDIPAEVEQAIRRDERRSIARLLDGDLRRFAHVLGAVFADPPVTRPERQAAARVLNKEQRRAIRSAAVDPARRMAIYLSTLVEQIDPEENNGK